MNTEVRPMSSSGSLRHRSGPPAAASAAGAGAVPASSAEPVTVGGVAVSGRAFDEIAKAAAKRATRPRGLRVGIRGGGCTGFSYFFEWSDAAPRPEDLVIARPDAPDGVPVIIDPKSKVFLAGSTLEYASTLMHRGFKWTNPNVKGSCGCGESVQF